MKKYDRGWASLEIGAALLIVMIIVAWGAGIWQDYLKTKGWQAASSCQQLGQCSPLLYREKLHNSPGQ